MKVAVRTDASVVLGTGHFVRCLTLAEALRERGAQVLFISREEQGNITDSARIKGFSVFHISGTRPLNASLDAEKTMDILRSNAPIDWLVVDHYRLGQLWEEKVRPSTKRILVVDDLADRPHDCDLLLDQNLFPDAKERYRTLVPSGCRRLFGPGHALLRPEFAAVRENLRNRDGTVRRLLIFFGGSDPGNETMKALTAVRLTPYNGLVDVIVGNANPHREEICSFCSTLPDVRVHVQTSRMAELIAAADLAVGAGGTATWERCFLGLPAITMILAANQEEVTRAVACAGAAINVGWQDQVAAADLARELQHVMNDAAALRRMSDRGMGLFNGTLNTTETVVEAMLELSDEMSE